MGQVPRGITWKTTSPQTVHTSVPMNTALSRCSSKKSNTMRYVKAVGLLLLLLVFMLLALGLLLAPVLLGEEIRWR
jgi:hypothetical protein